MHKFMFAKPGGLVQILHTACDYYYLQLLTLTDLTTLAELSDDELKHLKKETHHVVDIVDQDLVLQLMIGLPPSPCAKLHFRPRGKPPVLISNAATLGGGACLPWDPYAKILDK